MRRYEFSSSALPSKSDDGPSDYGLSADHLAHAAAAQAKPDEALPKGWRKTTDPLTMLTLYVNDATGLVRQLPPPPPNPVYNGYYVDGYGGVASDGT